MTHVAMARTAIAKIQAFMTSLQGHAEACEREKCVVRKAISIKTEERHPRWSLWLHPEEWAKGSAPSFTPLLQVPGGGEMWLLTASSSCSV